MTTVLSRQVYLHVKTFGRKAQGHFMKIRRSNFCISLRGEHIKLGEGKTFLGKSTTLVGILSKDFYQCISLQSANVRTFVSIPDSFEKSEKDGGVHNDRTNRLDVEMKNTNRFDAEVERMNRLDMEMRKLEEKMKKERLKHKRVLFFTLICIVGLYTYFESYNPEFFLYDIFLNFCLKYVDCEVCHDLFLHLGKYNLLPYDTSNDSAYATSDVKYIHFLNPFGVAAGFDKNGVCIDSILKLGFSFIEVGTVTPRAQKGNEKPRIFRDIETKSVINACGFNNIGCDKVCENLIWFRKKQESDKLLSRHIVGVSIGKNKDTDNITDDLSYCIEKIARYADYIAINVSSPNTPGLRDNQESNKLKNIILHVQREVTRLEESNANRLTGERTTWVNTTRRKPLIFVKLAPDLENSEKKKIAQVLLETGVDGMIISNTTTNKFDIKSFENKKGGVSGEKLKDMSTNFISEMYLYTEKKIPIIASGGIFSGADALEKIEAGASVCQLYSCLVFNGVKSAVKIKREFNNLLYQRGYYNLREAIGKKHERDKRRK
ncbi:dihydroorotate dehydrogenase, putative (DHODH) [Plasmodium ovale wallikeri]|uniref:Dihydroorotate dehydrogenase (quinone), mitochondrial n=2 Tax=Plasmodium ovale TaxID=36330 RepID=A0A1A8Z647_PLAOA|nr:dihydroorotate dehydrogenase, putative (DHODH) [Plasmodium ovale wallikeri]SBT39879.1 dihydroorotate dehydrogenase, putative (DHODH) [Plasmodium ovale wallikeri]SBT77882.1 dihydroorotate dehydrogenase, putative [Plasmodium ovale]